MSAMDGEPTPSEAAINVNHNSIRLYPDWIPVIENEPTKEQFKKVYRPEFGWCIISKTHFTPGEVIAHVYGGIIKRKSELHTVQKSQDVHIYDEWFTGLVTHSCDPNTYFDKGEETFVVTKEINPGDIVTCDYEVTEDYLARPFECKCGAENCRGLIEGRLAKHTR